MKFTNYLQNQHNTKVKIVPPEEDEKLIKKYDKDSKYFYYQKC